MQWCKKVQLDIEGVNGPANSAVRFVDGSSLSAISLDSDGEIPKQSVNTEHSSRKCFHIVQFIEKLSPEAGTRQAETLTSIVVG